jgi:hypothetical protein
MLHASTSDWTSSCLRGELWLERVYDVTSDYCTHMSRFGTPADLAKGLRAFTRLRRDLVEIALLERQIETVH